MYGGLRFFVPMISEQPEGPSRRIRKRTFLKILSPGRKIFGKAGPSAPWLSESSGRI